MGRTRTPKSVELAVLSKSKRRCVLCFYLKQDLAEKNGQIAHLDKDPSNSVEDNLAWMCLDHHSLFDTKTSQHKNYTIEEVKSARIVLYQAVARSAPFDSGIPPTACHWDVRYSGAVADVLVLRRADQHRTRLAIVEDVTVINSSPDQVSLNVIFLIQYGSMRLAFDPVPIAGWEQVLQGFGMRRKPQVEFPLNLPGRSSVGGHIAISVPWDGAGRGYGGDDPAKRQYSLEFEEILTKEKRIITASAVRAPDKSNHNRYFETDIALPLSRPEPLLID